MKIRVLALLFFTFSVSTFAQVGIGTTAPNASSELDIVSTTKGVLIPRMTAAQRIAIVTPASGLLVYQTDAPVGFWFFNGTVWVQNSVAGWNLTGNAGTAPATNYLGTTDAQPLVIKTNATERMRILPTTGFVGIGTTTPTAKLHLVGQGSVVVYNNFEGGAIAPFTSGIVTGGAWTTTNTNFTTGAFGAQSGTGVNSSLSQMTYTVATPAGGGSVSFDYKVSSEATFDGFRFFINGTLIVQVTGVQTAFTSVSYPLVSGSNVLLWEYFKDGSLLGGDDKAYIDNVNIINNTSALRIVDGNQGVGKVLTSDATGLATWTTPTIPTSTAWLTSGNTGTTPATNFVGTSDAQNFVVRTNNLPRMTVLTNGNVGIGVATPTTMLHVEADVDNQPILRSINSNLSTGTASIGVLAQATATSLGSAGVVGKSNNNLAGTNGIGVLGDYAFFGAAVFGKSPTGNIADLPINEDAGVFGTVGNSLTGTGVYGVNLNTTIGAAYGMYCNGNFAVTGTKSASVPTSQGNQLVYCTESPELWFEDLGFGTLTNGSVHIKLDDMFQETVYIDNSHKIHVFVQEEGDSNGLFVTMDADNKGFTVKEKNAGRTNTSFSYRILAKRRFYQNQRFGVDANQPFENNLVKHKDVPVSTTNPQEMKRIVDEYTAKRANELQAQKSK
jgi:hypothetical protein